MKLCLVMKMLAQLGPLGQNGQSAQLHVEEGLSIELENVLHLPEKAEMGNLAVMVLHLRIDR